MKNWKNIVNFFMLFDAQNNIRNTFIDVVFHLVQTTEQNPT
jgi:hypothetical protein